MSRSGSLFRRCSTCGWRKVAKNVARCGGCGADGDTLKWGFQLDMTPTAHMGGVETERRPPVLSDMGGQSGFE
jgi:hypothetical protein